MIHLDAAATSPVRREVLEAMLPVLAQVPGNPASHHEWGETAARILNQAQASVAASLGVRAAEIIFTSGGTESDNAAIKGISLAVQRAEPARNRLIISAIEHPAVLDSAQYLAQYHGFDVVLLPVSRAGFVNPDVLEKHLGPTTALVSIMAANNEIGTVQDIAALAALSHQHGARFHSDAVQAVGAVNLAELSALGVDALTLAGHKLGAPKGNGILFLKSRTPFEPLIHGGGQQRGRRSGTQDVAGALAFATALRLALAEDHASQRERRDTFIRRVLDVVPSAMLTGDPSHRVPGLASFCFPGLSGESILLQLQARGVLCASGSACAAGSDDPSHVLIAAGYDDDTALSAVRFSFGASTSQEELEQAVQALAESVAELKRLG